MVFVVSATSQIAMKPCHCLQFVCFSVSISCGIAAAEDLSADRSIYWRSERCCALNSLYMLLRLESIKCDYLTLRDSLLKEDLSSLEDIRRAASDLGVTLRVVHATPEELRTINGPVLVHFETVTLRGNNAGHFGIVTEIADHHVAFLDGTTAEPMEMSISEFERHWSGYAAFRSSRPLRLAKYLEGALVLGFGAMAGHVWLRHRSRLSRP